jgi:processive 1,2-diacylglycerol beta-glucosyltransferase
MKKILILYTSIGLGHKSIAENIGFYLTRDGYEVSLYDAHKVQGGFLADWGKKLYLVLIKNLPFIWNWLYTTKWFINLTLPYRIKVASHNYKNVLVKINEIKPNVVISTHNTASAIVSYLKQEGLYKGFFGIAFSDYHLHKFWLFESSDFYLANTQDQKDEMISLDTSSNKIFVCGITLKPKQAISNQQSAIRAVLHIPTENKVILFSSGSQGIGLDKTLLTSLSKLERATVIVACGKDERLVDELKNDFPASNILPLGYYSSMDELYSISDLYVSKPGGLSIAEALQWKIPVLIFYILPGGEVFNYQYLLERRLIMPKTDDLLSSILEELKTSTFKRSLAINSELFKLIPADPKVSEVIKSL